MDVTRIKPEYQPISDGQISFLNDIAKKYNKENEVIKKDVTELYEKEFGGLPKRAGILFPLYAASTVRRCGGGDAG